MRNSNIKQIAFTAVMGLVLSACGSSSSSTYTPTAATLSEVTAVPTPSNNMTPRYTFSSDKAGTITYGGSCGSAVTTTAIIGNNTITYGMLAVGTYSDCTITVTTALGKVSDALNITTFEIYTITKVPSCGTAADMGKAIAKDVTGKTIKKVGDGAEVRIWHSPDATKLACMISGEAIVINSK